MAAEPESPTLRLAESPADYVGFGGVCREYVGWCRNRYADLAWFVEEVFGYQSLDAELEVLATRYGPPNGRTLIATLGGKVVAGGAYRRTGDEVCELKRLYVTDAARGHGLGRKLCNALMASAKADGFATMQLDTGDRMTEALALYDRLGFQRIGPYHAYPDRLLPYMVFMQRQL